MPQQANDRPSEQGTSPSARRPRWRRVLFRLFLIGLLGLVVATAFVKTSTGRGWMFAILAGRIEHDTGIQVRIGSSQLSVLRGEITLHDVLIQAAERERPFVTAEEIEAMFEWRALFAWPIRLDHVFVHNVAAETAMLPTPRQKSGRDAEPLPLHVKDLRWEAGAVGPWLGDERYRVWFDRLQVTRIGGVGTLRDGILRVTESSGVLELEHPDRPTIEADVDLSGSIDLDGTIRYGTVTLLGEGCQGEASLTGTDPRNLMIEGRLEARLGQLFPGSDLDGSGAHRGPARLGWSTFCWRRRRRAVSTPGAVARTTVAGSARGDRTRRQAIRAGRALPAGSSARAKRRR